MITQNRTELNKFRADSGQRPTGDTTPGRLRQILSTVSVALETHSPRLMDGRGRGVAPLIAPHVYYSTDQSVKN